MTIAFWCVLTAALLPYVWVGAAKGTNLKFDNSKPRVFLAGLEGWPKRADWAQSNTFEAFPAFAAAVIVASLVGNINPDTLNNLAMLFIGVRVAHGICYILDQAILRSLMWTIGMGSWIAMLVMSA